MVIATLIDEQNRRRVVHLKTVTIPDSYLLCAGMMFTVQPWEVPAKPDVPILATYRQRVCMDVSAYPHEQVA